MNVFLGLLAVNLLSFSGPPIGAIWLACGLVPRHLGLVAASSFGFGFTAIVMSAIAIGLILTPTVAFGFAAFSVLVSCIVFFIARAFRR